MNPSIVDILERLDRSGLDQIEAEIRHKEYEIRMLKNEWDKAYSQLINQAYTYALREGIVDE